jgi:deazaflavin-dependent oxidoreductase (nitroreductase family)
MGQAEFTKALERTDEVDITVTGRKTGRQITLPVWFVAEGDRLWLLPVRGSDSDWYRNLLKTPTIRLSAEGAEYEARVRPITDPGKVREVVRKFRAKYGAAEIEKYYEKPDVAVEVPLEPGRSAGRGANSRTSTRATARQG